MKDIAGFLGDINGTPLEIAEGSTDDQVKAAVKNQVDAKKEELRKRGYTVKEDYLSKNNGKIITTLSHSLRRLQELQVSEWLQQFNHALAEIVEF